MWKTPPASVKLWSITQIHWFTHSEASIQQTPGAVVCQNYAKLKLKIWARLVDDFKEQSVGGDGVISIYTISEGSDESPVELGVAKRTKNLI